MTRRRNFNGTELRSKRQHLKQVHVRITQKLEVYRIFSRYINFLDSIVFPYILNGRLNQSRNYKITVNWMNGQMKRLHLYRFCLSAIACGASLNKDDDYGYQFTMCGYSVAQTTNCWPLHIHKYPMIWPALTKQSFLPCCPKYIRNIWNSIALIHRKTRIWDVYIQLI